MKNNEIKNERFYLYRDTDAIEHELNRIERKRKYMNELLFVMDKLGFPVSEEQFQEIVIKQGPKAYIKAVTVAGSQATLGNLKIKESALAEMIELPDTGRTEAIAAELNTDYFKAVPMSNYVFTEDREYVLAPGVRKQIIDKNTDYPKTKEIEAMAKKLVSLAFEINSIREEITAVNAGSFGEQWNHPGNTIDNLITWNGKAYQADFNILNKVYIK